MRNVGRVWLSYKVDRDRYFSRIGYEPTKYQREYHECEARFRVVCAGRRFGKSRMAAADMVTDLFQPNKLLWIVGPTYDLGMKEFRYLWDDLIVGQKLGLRKDVKKAFNPKQGDMYIEFPWRTKVEVRSAEKPESLVGEGLDRVVLSEAAKLKKTVWDRYVRPALADKRGRADAVTTPEGKNWLYDFWMLGALGDDPDYKSWRMPSWFNNVIFPGGEEDPEILLMKRTMIEEEFLQEIAAEFTAVVGRIYGEFDERVHVFSDDYKFNPRWPNYIAFDWGFANPLAAVEFQVSPDDHIYIWREHYHQYRTLEWHINELKNRQQPDGYKIDLTFGDAADPDAVAYVNQHLAPCIANADSKPWAPGIRVMKQFMKVRHEGQFDEYERPIMETRYHVHASCKNHINEMLTYRAKDNVGQNEWNTSSVVSSKADDHTCDAMRYALMHLYELGVTHHLSDVHPAMSGVAPKVVEHQGRRVGETELTEPDTFFQFEGLGGMRF